MPSGRDSGSRRSKGKEVFNGAVTSSRPLWSPSVCLSVLSVSLATHRPHLWFVFLCSFHFLTRPLQPRESSGNFVQNFYSTNKLQQQQQKVNRLTVNPHFSKFLL